MKIRGKDFKLHKKTDNKGSAMVVVIIAMAFIGILASVLMYMSLLNYQMKANNLQAKDNFYSAETVLDEIRVHMEEQVSSSLGTAYTQILENYDDTSVAEKESKLRYSFLNSMQKAYQCSDTVSLNYYDLQKMFNYLSPELQENTVLQTSDGVNSYTIQMVGGTVQMTGVNGSGDAVSDLPKGQLTLFTDGLSFQKLKVTYTNTSGYVSVIETDIRVKMPDMSFAQAVSLPALTGMSLVAKDTIQVVAESGKLSEAKVAGSFYADRVLVGNEDDAASANVTLSLLEPTNAENDDKRMVAATELYLGKGATLTSDSYGELWAGKITMHGGATDSGSATIHFNGNDVYVAENLRMDGANNNFTAGSLVDENYSGQYVGFGTGEDGNGSAIVVNGTGTDIDLSNLVNLTLAGNTYIATKNANDNLTEADGNLNGNASDRKDILMGQSIAVKSDQLAYLVPADLVQGGSNPVTREQADALGNTAVDFDTASSALGGNTLSSYGITKFITGGSSEKQGIRTFYKRLNSKITIVYYYVSFDSSTQAGREAANRYFQDYYKVNKSTMDAYASIYTDGIKIRNQSAGAYIMHLAGNVVMFNKDQTTGSYSGTLQNATLGSDANNLGYQQQLVADASKFQALCKKLIDGYEQLAPSEKEETANVYSNLVETGEITSFTAVLNGSTGDKTAAKYFESTAYPECKAVIVDGDYNYPEAGHADFKGGIIIATGDVKIQDGKEFNGVILAGGNILLGQNVKVTPDKEAVLRALTYSKEITTSAGNQREFHVVDFLKGGEGYLQNNNKTYVNSDINLGDLIVYENWQKQ
jgi:Tfp pilus assembly protein PilE